MVIFGIICIAFIFLALLLETLYCKRKTKELREIRAEMHRKIKELRDEGGNV